MTEEHEDFLHRLHHILDQVEEKLPKNPTPRQRIRLAEKLDLISREYAEHLLAELYRAYDVPRCRYLECEPDGSAPCVSWPNCGGPAGVK